MKKKDIKLPALFDSSDLKGFFNFMKGLNKPKKEKSKLHPKGFCNNPDCETCKNGISNE